MTEVQVGSGGVDAELHAQRSPRLQLVEQGITRDEGLRAALEDVQLLFGRQHVTYDLPLAVRTTSRRDDGYAQMWLPALSQVILA